jgi:hypothetical protein
MACSTGVPLSLRTADRFDLIGRQQFAEDQHLKDVGAVRRASR